MVKTLHFQGAGLIPGQGTKIPHTTQRSQKNKGRFIFCHPKLFNILEIIIWLCDELGRGSGILQNPSSFIPVAGKGRRGYIQGNMTLSFLHRHCMCTVKSDRGRQWREGSQRKERLWWFGCSVKMVGFVLGYLWRREKVKASKGIFQAVRMVSANRNTGEGLAGGEENQAIKNKRFM